MFSGNESCLQDLHTQLDQTVPRSLSNIRISILLHFFLCPLFNSSPMTHISILLLPTHSTSSYPSCSLPAFLTCQFTYAACFIKSLLNLLDLKIIRYYMAILYFKCHIFSAREFDKYEILSVINMWTEKKKKKVLSFTIPFCKKRFLWSDETRV